MSIETEIEDRYTSKLRVHFELAELRAYACIEHLKKSGHDADRVAAVFAIGEASGIRNFMRQRSRDIADVAERMHALELYLDQIKYNTL